MKNLNIIAPINFLSYGIFSVRIIEEFLKMQNIDPLLINIGNFDTSSYKGCPIKNPNCLHDMEAPCLKIFHQNSFFDICDYDKKFGYSFFEVEHFNQEEINSINTLDTFIVPTEWAKSVCKNNNIKSDVVVVNPGIEHIYEEQYIIDSLKNRKRDKVKFLVVGKLEERKCHKQIVDAFGEAFDIFDNVEMDMCVSNIFLTPQERNNWYKYIKTSKNGHKINIVDFVTDRTEFLKKYIDYDVFLGISRAEGFFLPLVEAMSLGRLCVASDVTAMSEYVRDNNCIVINKNKDIPAIDGKWFDGSSTWADFKMEDMVNSMIKAKEEIENGNLERNICAMRDVRSRFSWEKSAKEIVDVIF